MPVVAELRRGVALLSGRGTLLEQCAQAGIPVASSCSGRSVCALCLVRVLEGSSALTPPDADERAALARRGAGPGERLACRCTVADPSALVRLTAGYW